MPDAPDVAMAEKDVVSDLTARLPYAIVVTNPALEDNPIVYVNAAFETMTGYARMAAIGRNCRFLQGEHTDPDSVQRLRDAIEKEEDATVTLLNYRADGTTFMNRLHITTVRGEETGAKYFLGVQEEVDDQGETDRESRARRSDLALSEIQHRVKNHLAMIVSMIRLHASASSAQTEFDTIARRVEALHLLYDEIDRQKVMNGANDDRVALGAYLSRVANAIAHLDGRPGVRVNVDADDIHVDFELATQLGLVLSETMTNALQHAFDGRRSGVVEVRVKAMSGGGVRLSVGDDGIGMPKGSAWPQEGNLGGRIVRQLVQGLGATLTVARQASGTLVVIDVPRAPASF